MSYSLNKKLREAVDSNDLEMAKESLENGADIHTFQDYPLRTCVEKANLSMLELLLKYKPNIHVGDDMPLCTSIKMDQIEIANILLDLGANMHAEKAYPIKTAAEKGYFELVKRYLKLDYAKPDMILPYIVSHKNSEMVSALLDAGANPATDDFYSINVGVAKDMEILKILLNHIKDNHNKDYQKALNHAFFYACASGYLNVADYLLNEGADPNKSSYDEDFEPLSTAQEEGYQEIVELILKARAGESNEKSIKLKI